MVGQKNSHLPSLFEPSTLSSGVTIFGRLASLYLKQYAKDKRSTKKVLILYDLLGAFAPLGSMRVATRARAFIYGKIAVSHQTEFPGAPIPDLK